MFYKLPTIDTCIS